MGKSKLPVNDQISTNSWKTFQGFHSCAKLTETAAAYSARHTSQSLCFWTKVDTCIPQWLTRTQPHAMMKFSAHHNIGSLLKSCSHSPSPKEIWIPTIMEASLPAIGFWISPCSAVKECGDSQIPDSVVWVRFHMKLQGSTYRHFYSLEHFSCILRKHLRVLKASLVSSSLKDFS